MLPLFTHNSDSVEHFDEYTIIYTTGPNVLSEAVFDDGKGDFSLDADRVLIVPVDKCPYKNMVTRSHSTNYC